MLLYCPQRLYINALPSGLPHPVSYPVELFVGVEALFEDRDGAVDALVVRIVWRQMNVLLEMIDAQLAQAYLQQKHQTSVSPVNQMLSCQSSQSFNHLNYTIQQSFDIALLTGSSDVHLHASVMQMQWYCRAVVCKGLAQGPSLRGG